MELVAGWQDDRVSWRLHRRPDVIVVPAAGGEPRVLTANLPNGGYPRFSRDGRWIYFAVVDGEAHVWEDGGRWWRRG